MKSHCKLSGAATQRLRIPLPLFIRAIVLFAVVAPTSLLLLAGAPRPASVTEFPGQPQSSIRLSLDPDHSTVHFTLSATGHTVHGEFKLTRGEFSIDPASGKMSGEAVIDARSGDSGNSGRDSKMHHEVLESATYPDIIFRPDRAEGFSAMAGRIQGTVYGTFLIHGASHALSAPVTVEFSNDRWSATVNFTVPYVDWGLKNPSTFLLHVGKSVEVAVETSGSLSRIVPSN